MPKPSPGQKPDPMSGVVDRLLAQLPGLQGGAPVSRSAPRQVAPPGTSIHTVPYPMEDLLGPWARLVLGLALGTMMAWWPYPRTCGFPLAGYLTALFTVVLGGGWAAMSAWRYRASLAHVLSLILVFYGMMLVAAELLPRTGYAVDHATWQCEENTHGSSWSASLS
jgi:hypothetical protein